MDDEQDLPAGDFGAWLRSMRAALRGEGESDVPCDGCTACCRSSQFIHVAPDETETLAHIPAELLFPAPGRPEGHVLLGYDERGHCPMLIDDTCSIYEQRPRTCRTYDCRVFPAAGLDASADGDHSGAEDPIAQRARRWRFDFTSQADRTQHDAVRAAATFLSDDAASTNVTQLAVRAVEFSDTFLVRDDETGRTTIAGPKPHASAVELQRRTRARDTT